MRSHQGNQGQPGATRAIRAPDHQGQSKAKQTMSSHDKYIPYHTIFFSTLTALWCDEMR